MMENLILILLFLVIIVFIFNHKKSKEAFQSNTSIQSELQVKVDTLIEEFKRKISTLVQLLNTSYQNTSNDNLLNEYKTMINELTNIEKQLSNNLDNEVDKSGNILYNINNKINEIETKIADLESLSTLYKPELVKEPSTIKSVQNGMNMGLSETKLGNYNIHLNNGCLRVDASGNYNVAICNPNDPTQEFESKYIINDVSYDNNLMKGMDTIKPSDNIRYPFSLIKSSNNGFCLQNNHGKISLEPCQVRKSQRWRHVANVNSCNSSN